MNNQVSKKRSSILILFTLAVFAFSCGKSEKELLVGTWTGTDFKFDQTEGPNLSALVEGGKGLHMEGKMILEETGTYIITSPNDVINGKGTWKVKDGNLHMTDESGNEEIYSIVALDESQLITSNEVKMESPLGNIAGKITLTYEK